MERIHFDASFRYPSGFVLNCSFVSESAVTIIAGPSGTGKTTILNLISGLLHPNRGRIELGTQILFDGDKGISIAPEKRGIGYVFQDYQLFPHLNVLKNLAYGEVRRNRKAIDRDKVIETLQLGSSLERYPIALSGGEKQRVALGRAILSAPKLLLLDEPFSAVDQELKENLMQLTIETAHCFSIPLILVSHDEQSIAGLDAPVIRLAR